MIEWHDIVFYTRSLVIGSTPYSDFKVLGLKDKDRTHQLESFLKELGLVQYQDYEITQIYDQRVFRGRYITASGRYRVRFYNNELFIAIKLMFE